MPGLGNVGERVRDLRLTRRLSQAQLAGHDLSDSYISLIESGKRTPTPAVLRLLAERLGCTAEYLSEGIAPEQRAHLEVRERHADLALLAGRPAVALAGFDEVIEHTDDPELTARSLRGRARALEAMDRYDDAIGALESLREQAERDPGRSSWLPPVISLARCYHAAGDLGQAIALGERALARLHELELTVGQEHTEVSRVLLLAYVDRSEPDRAHGLGRSVLVDAETGGVPISLAYQRASAKALDESAVGDALYFAEQALAAHVEGERLQAHARLQMAGARALLRGTAPYGIGAAGWDAAQEALGLLRASAPVLQGAEATQCAIETARALVLLGEPARAVHTAEEALTNLVGDSPLELVDRTRALETVRARLVLAQARLAQADRGAATSVLRTATTELDRITPSRPTAHLYRELGDLYESAGDTAGATGAYRRALEAAGLRPISRAQHVASHVVGL
ncbi:helix-turn-helix domain-containing protein [Actinomadura sp. HBU206391]|uniref:helix-turn-helix domain-containing protein n=1 Tax=Actinomadura sp. HBU206391 TaxID=2731692 RepID=UPI00164FC2E2|nr:helix-turn-helix domain-containing protein [Actinomadura sp. HBU206391]MBC6456429.1 helix-turn-helix transcriptional regulator [Actinomadura sp. HBU206391]